ncbi:DUF4248 domain-containing protein [uncultured Prevotella sp.]|uniref:DUF4248 domain-containing protein n=1 Tax=uncultured Prevotella sp. TaxID=159272 RepID=UPI00262E234D|nr:DUF4248 domain-containing protein [uncultured Prevotella sp.]
MADKMFENNQVSIVGEIVSDFRFSHEVYGEGFYMVDVAVNRLMSWIRRCKPLHDALLDQGYRKTTKWLSPREVKLITEYLGEP